MITEQSPWLEEITENQIKHEEIFYSTILVLNGEPWIQNKQEFWQFYKKKFSAVTVAFQWES